MAEENKNVLLRDFMINEDNVKSYFLECPFTVQRNDFYHERMFMPKNRNTEYFYGLEQLEEAYKKKKEKGIYKEDMVAPEFRSEFCKRMYWRLRKEADKAWENPPKDLDREQKREWNGGRESETLRGLSELMGTMYAVREEDDRFGTKENLTTVKFKKSCAEADYSLRSRTPLYSDALVQLFTESYPKFKEHALEVIHSLQVNKERQEIVDRAENLEKFFNANTYDEKCKHLDLMKSPKTFNVPDFMREDFYKEISVGLSDMAKKNNHSFSSFEWEEGSSENKYKLGKRITEKASDYFQKAPYNESFVNELYNTSPEFKSLADKTLLKLQHKEQDRIAEVDRKSAEPVLIRSVDDLKVDKISVGHYRDNVISIEGLSKISIDFKVESVDKIPDENLEKLYNSDEFMKRFKTAISEKMGEEKVKNAFSALESSEALRRVETYGERDYIRENNILNAAMVNKQVSFDTDFNEVIRMKKEIRSALDLDHVVEKVRDDMVRENNAKKGRPDGLFTVDSFVVKDDKCIATVNFNFEEKNKKEYVYGGKTEIELPANPGMALKVLSKIQERYETDRVEQNVVAKSFYNKCIDNEGHLVTPKVYVPEGCISSVKNTFNTMVEECKKVSNAEKSIARINEDRKKRSGRMFGLGGMIDKVFHKKELEAEKRVLERLAETVRMSKARAESSAELIKVEEPMLNRTKGMVEQVMKKVNYAKIDLNEVKKAVNLAPEVTKFDKKLNNQL